MGRIKNNSLCLKATRQSSD